ncbi:MAG: helicase [Alphaproteobacteria bacterium]|nr:helicase [Alphaproteobacteria bacterium]
MPFLPSRRGEPVSGHGVSAVLGPTNTGKTHLAIERMLAHSSGIIGLPLRLLAREVYNKIAARVGEDAVALVTGEEKIKPRAPRFWVATVEAMPRDLDVSFLAVDEVQIAADLERGHVFTDRILHRRGRDETLLLGAATMRPLLERLLPGVTMITRPRLSQLEFAGDRKLTRQPRRTAIVAFAAEEVYGIAELIRRQHGGAAVVLGSLSPRTRNAQVAMFQNGDVDYLVATDAIGMGLNLDVDHVAFASDRKFDGYQFRTLTPAEFAQIAGRAGRALRNGTFGTTGRCAPFPPELVNALQNHSFDAVKGLQWRNSRLDFSSLAALLQSLALPSGHEALTRAPVAEDVRVLEQLARDSELRDQAQGRAAVERLWEACQVPDYRKVSSAAHAELVTTLFGFLMSRGCIPDAWFAAQVEQTDRVDGDIDTLSGRIAQIRSWTFVANRPDWLRDPDHWQGVTREIENKLSDALHERLTERFVDRRTSVLMRRLREKMSLNTEIGKTGDVIVEGHMIGRLDGFTFAPDAAAAGSEAKTLQAAAQQVVAAEISARAEKLSGAADEQFVLTADGTIRWTGDAVARLVPAEETLRPRLRIISDERLTGTAREKVQERLDLWLRTYIEKVLGPLFELSRAEDITGIARGIAYQLVEALGVLERQRIAAELKTLDQPSRALLRKYGARFGAYHIYVAGLLKPVARSLAALLWALRHDNVDLAALSGAQHLASTGRTSFPTDKSLPREAYRVLGYRQCGERAVRVDILERLADLIRPALGWRPASPGEKPAGAFDGRGFVVTAAMTSLAGSAGEDFASILRALGYRMEKRPALPEPVAASAMAASEAAGSVISEPDVAAGDPPDNDSGDADPNTAAAADVEPGEAGETGSATLREGDVAPGETPAVVTEPAQSDAAEDGQTSLPPNTLWDMGGAAVEETRPPQGAVEQQTALPPNTLWTTGAVEDAGEVAAAVEPAQDHDVVPEGLEGEEPTAAEVAQAEVVQQDPATSDPAGNADAVDAAAAEPAPAVIAGGSEAVSAGSQPGSQIEPQLVEVWRPGGRHEDHRGRHERPRPRRRHHGAPREEAQATAEPAGRSAEGGATGQPTERPRQGHRDGRRDFRKPREEGASAEARRDDRGRQNEGRGQDGNRDRQRPGERKSGDRKQGDRPDRKSSDREGGREFRGRDKSRDRDGPSLRPYATSAGPRDRASAVDPNSPFAKLAALKAQLTGGDKE